MSNAHEHTKEKLNTIVYIPARKNSSRLKDKALQDLGGHPLISYTVRIATAIKEVDHVFVDTDSENIAGVAKEYGAEVPFLRDPALATDKASLNDASQAFRSKVAKSIGPIKRVITLMPTSPFRNFQSVNALAESMKKHMSVITVLNADVDLENMFFQFQGETHSLSELLIIAPPIYDWIKGIGYFQGFTVKTYSTPEMNKYNNYKYQVLRNPIELVDIDYPKDLETARDIINEKIYDFGMDMQ
jgi:CMP-N-acetylneuraminic acid synthetase